MKEPSNPGGIVSVLITPSQLLAERAAGEPIRVLDVRWRLDRPDGHAEYLDGHIPGAVYVDLDTQLAQKGDAADGRHPLPTVEALQQSVRSWGIRNGDRVVVYDNAKSTAASRAWWLLRYAGLTDVRVLDGAFLEWKAQGNDVETGEFTAEPGTASLSYGHLPLLDIDGAAAFPSTGVLLDARAPERYRGETEPLDPRAGHIPGALNAPSTGNVNQQGRFLPAEQLRERFAELGVEGDVPVAAYCGSGITAAHNALALTLAGFEPAVYPGSWSQWSNHPDRPVVAGAEPEVPVDSTNAARR
jgi:thiosulfate/3-mercaptopyruvate sulfurtransferase